MFCFLCSLWMDAHHAFAQSGDDTGITWYKSFFDAGNNQPIEQALSKGNALLEQATDASDFALAARALKQLGLIHLTRTHDYEQAMDFLIKSLAIEDSLNLKEQRIFTYLAMSRVFVAVGDYYNSAQFLEEALDLNEPLNNTALLVMILNESGKVHAAMGKTDEARDNYELVLRYHENLDDPAVESDARYNLAHLATLQGAYKEALDQHKRALAIRRSLRDRKNEAQSLSDIGELYRLMKNDGKALANHTVALDIRQRLKDKTGISESYNHVGVLYFHQKKYQQAVSNLIRALEAGRESQAQNQMRRSYEYLSFCYEAMGDYKQALQHKDLFLAMNDFIQRDRNEEELLQMQNRYVIDKKEGQIEKLEMDRTKREQELAEQKKFRNVLFVIVGLCVIIALLVFYLYIQKQRSNKSLTAAHQKVQQQNLQLQELNATKDKFFSIISHDLKGPLNSLTSFSGLLINHTESLSKEEIQMLARDFDKSLKNLFVLLENLLEWSRVQTGNIEFTAEPLDLAAVLEQNKALLTAQAQNKNITLLNGREGPVMVNAHPHSINTVVRNLISNAIKFTPEGGAVMLNLKQVKDAVQVSIADTGVGMPAEVMKKLFRIDTKHSTKGTANEKGTGLGLILCKEFVEKNGGTIWVESEENKGTVFHFTLPAARQERLAVTP